MSAWSKRFFAGAVLAVLLLFADTLRSPEAQFTAQVYIGTVHTYQAYGRPMLEGVVACRYRPTCSDYSIAAVERFGIWRGLYLTAKRLASCTESVPMGTVDEPV